MTRVGVDRLLKFAFELAQSRPKKHLTSATKSTAFRYHAVLGRARGGDGENYPGVKWDKYHIDILTANFVPRTGSSRGRLGPVRRHPLDLGPACTGTIGIAPSAALIRKAISLRCSNRCGSAPDIAGQASPTRSA
jgi:tartrate dehydrogenase/decarboxylase/D-malate dehydrogenase